MEQPSRKPVWRVLKERFPNANVRELKAILRDHGISDTVFSSIFRNYGLYNGMSQKHVREIKEIDQRLAKISKNDLGAALAKAEARVSKGAQPAGFNELRFLLNLASSPTQASGEYFSRAHGKIKAFEKSRMPAQVKEFLETVRKPVEQARELDQRRSELLAVNQAVEKLEKLLAVSSFAKALGTAGKQGLTWEEQYENQPPRVKLKSR